MPPIALGNSAIKSMDWGRLYAAIFFLQDSIISASVASSPVLRLQGLLRSQILRDQGYQ